MLVVSYMGYKNLFFPVIYPLEGDLDIRLERETIPLQEVIISYADPVKILQRGHPSHSGELSAGSFRDDSLLQGIGQKKRSLHALFGSCAGCGKRPLFNDLIQRPGEHS